MYESDTCEACGRDFPYYLAKKCEKCIKKLCPVCIFTYLKYITDVPPQLWKRSGPPSQRWKVCSVCFEKLRMEDEEENKRAEEEEHEYEYYVDYDAEYGDDY